MAAGDVVLLANVDIGGGLRLLTGTVTLDGGNPTPVQLSSYISAVQVGQATIQGSTATGADPNQVSAVANGTALDVYAWKVTTGGAAGNPTEVASTDNARLVNWLVIGIDIARKGMLAR